ncbi:hypothetical protein AN403_5710 [Pseudomonas fluorescens]|uniref:Uncharacterized protein n=1 Tax=Pseudomonas fluorescens TaxID=294 RepID=A0A0N8NY04_PSEFL|nr:hypothetical protein AN403_5710 [Pseudomonas fluorescens]
MCPRQSSFHTTRVPPSRKAFKQDANPRRSSFSRGQILIKKCRSDPGGDQSIMLQIGGLLSVRLRYPHKPELISSSLAISRVETLGLPF